MAFLNTSMQAKIIQSEGMLASLAQWNFDANLEQLYNDYGVSLNGNAIDLVCRFPKLLSLKSTMASYTPVFAKQGVLELMFLKVNDQGVPILWTLKGKALKDALAILGPFIGVLDAQDYLNAVTSMQSKLPSQFPIPDDITKFVELAIKTKNVTQQNMITMAMIHVLNNTVCVYNAPVKSRDKTTITGFKTSLITRNASLMEQLAKSRLLNVADPQKGHETFVKKVWGAPTDLFGAATKEILEGKIPVARISVDAYDANDNVTLSSVANTYELVTPDVQVLPVRLMTCLSEGIMLGIKQNKIMRISCRAMSVDDPAYTSVVTVDPVIYRKLYADSKDQAQVAKRANLPIGFSVRTNRLALLNCESSIYGSKGYANINVFAITGFQKVTESQVNKTFHNINPSMAIAMFEKQLNGKTPAELNTLVEAIPELKAAMKDNPRTLQFIIPTVQTIHYSVLLNYMLSQDKSIAKQVEDMGNRLKVTPVKLTGNTFDEKVKCLKDLMKNNRVRISYLSKNGMVDILATDNEAMLMAKWGKDYKLLYESTGIKMQELKSRIVSGKYSSAQIKEMVAMTGLPLDISLLTNTTPDAVDAWFALLPPKKDFSPVDGQIAIRVLSNSSTLYKTIVVKNISGVAVESDV